MKNAATLAIALPSIPVSIGAGLGGDVDWIGALGVDEEKGETITNRNGDYVND